MLERSDDLAVIESKSRFCRLMDGFLAETKKYSPQPKISVQQKIRAWRSKKDEPYIKKCLAAAERVRKKGFLLTLHSLSREMRMSYRRLHRLLESHPDLRHGLTLVRHPNGAPVFVPR